MPADQAENEIMDAPEEAAMIDADEGEEVPQEDDAAMDSDDAQGEDDDREGITLHNDSVAHFDAHTDSIFAIAQHPTHPNIVATGGGDDTGYVFSVPPSGSPQHIKSSSGSERPSIQPLAKLEGHTDSLNALAFLYPSGSWLLSAGLDGQLRVYADSSPSKNGQSWTFVTSGKEVDEINWLAPCPSADHPDTFALGGSDGSVWVYSIDATSKENPLVFVNSYFTHTAPCTAGSWTPDGKLLATASEDSSFYVWDVFGDAALAGIVDQSSGGQHVVSMTAADERFQIEGGLFSIAISPPGTMAAVGGEGGAVRIVGLPRLAQAAGDGIGSAKSGAGAKSKDGGGKKDAAPKGGDASAGQAGVLLASLQAQSESIETLTFSPSPSIPLLAVGSVDGSIAFFDTKANFNLRKHIKAAHEDVAVTKVEFIGVEGSQAWILTSSGYDGVVRRWDARGGNNQTANQMIGEYKGHRGGGEGGAVMSFVQGGGGRYIVTAGDDAVSLAFDTQVS